MIHTSPSAPCERGVPTSERGNEVIVRRWEGPASLPPVREWPVVGRRSVYNSRWVSLDLVAVEPPGAPAYEHHVVDVPYDAVGVVAHHSELGVLLLYRHRFITDTSGF